MFYRFGRGRGFRGAAPGWPYIGRGRGGYPRCWGPAANVSPSYESTFLSVAELEDLKYRINILQQQVTGMEKSGMKFQGGV